MINNSKLSYHRLPLHLTYFPFRFDFLFHSGIWKTGVRIVSIVSILKFYASKRVEFTEVSLTVLVILCNYFSFVWHVSHVEPIFTTSRLPWICFELFLSSSIFIIYRLPRELSSCDRSIISCMLFPHIILSSIPSIFLIFLVFFKVNRRNY